MMNEKEIEEQEKNTQYIEYSELFWPDVGVTTSVDMSAGRT